jgi:hypothetical protein
MEASSVQAKQKKKQDEENVIEGKKKVNVKEVTSKK